MTRASRTRNVLTSVAFALLSFPAFACINTFASSIMEAKGTGNVEAMKRITAEAEDAHRKDPSLANTNDLAVAWVVTGRVADGIRLLRELESAHPGSGVVAANLGTALELAGQDTEALQWIREGVRRDPTEHEGSEWVHVKILEAKLAIENDPNWLRKKSVAGWREGERFPLDERSRPRLPADMLKAIAYQLQERTQFVGAPDAIVGDLYLTMGDIAQSVPGVITDSWERDRSIYSAYQSALYYGTIHEARARSRMEAADQRVDAALPARQATAAREQEVRNHVQERERTAERRKIERKNEQDRRRWLSVGVFTVLALVVAGALWFRRRTRVEPPPA